MRVTVALMIAAVFSILAIKYSEQSLGGGRLTASATDVSAG
ncbi:MULTISPECIES: hypothetical protein [Rhizobium/Agrobacterium group]|jgi:hypothetical protein|nr:MULTISPECIES: hypothetical protein [unclassified Agrobacterium]AOG10453.1 hypothetical protein BSY240_654 [Agrobacterium sp. RAC06]MDM7980217.1 hypothetical protein [Rhizobium sp.]MDM8015333.1 hypothetical protein [Rhizobium sp.]MDZ7874482.1 hypothetical protein [Rhizobium sp.]